MMRPWTDVILLNIGVGTVSAALHLPIWGGLGLSLAATTLLLAVRRRP